MSAAEPIPTGTPEPTSTPAPATPPADPAPAAPTATAEKTPTSLNPLKGIAKGTPSSNPAAPPLTVPDWAGTLADENKAFVAQKGYKTLDDALRSAQMTERMKGIPTEQLLRKPDWTKPESVAEFRAALGVPDKPEAYQNGQFDGSEGVLDGNIMAGISHAMGLTQPQHEIFLEAASAYFEGAIKEQAEETQRVHTQQMNELKKEWGAKASEFEQAANSAVAQVGISEETIAHLNAALGPAGTLALFAQIGQHLGESKPPGDRTGPALLSRSSAQAALRAYMDPNSVEAKAVIAGDQNAIRKYQQLQEIAFAE